MGWVSTAGLFVCKCLVFILATCLLYHLKWLFKNSKPITQLMYTIMTSWLFYYIEWSLYSIVYTFLECSACSGEYAQLTYHAGDTTHYTTYQRLLHRTLVLIINWFVSIIINVIFQLNILQMAFYQTSVTSLCITCQVIGRPLQILNSNNFSSSLNNHLDDKTRLLTALSSLSLLHIVSSLFSVTCLFTAPQTADSVTDLLFGVDVASGWNFLL